MNRKVKKETKQSIANVSITGIISVNKQNKTKPVYKAILSQMEKSQNKKNILIQ